MLNYIKTNSYINKYGCTYFVSKFVSNDSKNRYYEIIFPYTGYSAIFTKTQIVRGNVKDRFFPCVAGVGYLGNATASRGDRFYSVWHNMIHRCYNPNFGEYKRYGALGVKVCLRWHCFEYFLRDIIIVDRFDFDKFMNGKIELDKDFKQINLPSNQKIYSLYTCTFLSSIENNYLSSTHYGYRAVSPDGTRYYGHNIAKFCKENDLNLKLVHQVVNGWQKSTQNGWKFSK